MALLICAPDRSNVSLASDLTEHLPEVDIRIWPDVGDPKDIEFAVLWKHPQGLVAQLPNLKAISSLGAGVEHLINDPDIPETLPVGRFAGPKLAHDMATWLVARVLADWLNFSHFNEAQRAREWSPKAPGDRPNIGILGLGHMGQATAKAFQALDFQVLGWNNLGQQTTSIETHHGPSGLATVVSQAHYLICLLPLTEQTRGILNAQLMEMMPKDSVLINVGRGAHLVEEDLLNAFENARPARAILDVFSTEPLPKEHPFWSHPSITLSPHCAALTDPKEAAQLLAESYQQVMQGQAPIGAVDLSRGY